MKNTITIIMEGPEISQDGIDLTVFVQDLDYLRKAIHCVDRQVYSGDGSTRILVSKLSRKNPTQVTLALQPAEAKNDRTQMVVGVLTTTMDNVANGSIPDDVNYELLDLLNGLVRPIGKSISTTNIVVNDDHFDITREFGRHIEEALENAESCLGSIEGSLDAINLHGNTNKFTIYPSVGPQKVICDFPPELHDIAISSIEKNVVVTGTLYYRPRDPFPFRVVVSAIDISPPDDELPTFDDLLGLAADTTDDTPSEVIIRRLRDGWH